MQAMNPRDPCRVAARVGPLSLLAVDALRRKASLRGGFWASDLELTEHADRSLQ